MDVTLLLILVSISLTSSSQDTQIQHTIVEDPRPLHTLVGFTQQIMFQILTTENIMSLISLYRFGSTLVNDHINAMLRFKISKIYLKLYSMDFPSLQVEREVPISTQGPVVSLLVRG